MDSLPLTTIDAVLVSSQRRLPDPLLWPTSGVDLSLKGVRFFVGVYNTGNPQDSERPVASEDAALTVMISAGEMTPEATVRVLYRKRPEISRQPGVAVSDEAIERAVALVGSLPARSSPARESDRPAGLGGRREPALRWHEPARFHFLAQQIAAVAPGN